jgi:hypothetical protein
VLRKVLVNGALVAMALVASLIVLEFALRLYERVPLLQINNFVRDHVDQFRVVASSMYDERLGWRAKPNLHLVVSVNGVLRTETTDSLGNRLSGKPRGASTSEVLAVGDSFTYGTDVGDGEAWPALLEDLIGAPVTNASSQGWGTDQIIMRAEDMIDLIHPRILILGFFWQDILRAEDEIDFGAYKPYYTIEADALALHDVPVPHITATVHDLGFARTFLGYSYAVFWAARRLALGDFLGSSYTEEKRVTPRGTGQAVTCLLLRRLMERARGDSIRLVLAMLHGNRDFALPQPAEALAVLGCAGELGYDTVDTWAPFARIFASDQTRFRALFVTPEKWSHLSAAGNSLVAAAIAQRLHDSESGR